VHNGSVAPTDAFAALPYRNEWFWVDDTDLLSKRALSFMTIVFAISEPDGSRDAPTVVTASAN